MLRFLGQKIINFTQNNKGVVAPIFAISAFILVTVTATAIDINSFNNAEKELQALADKAVKNALSRRKMNQRSSNNQYCEETFNNGFNENKDLEKNVNIKSLACRPSVITTGKGTSWTITVPVTIKTPISGLMGKSYDATIIATASLNDEKNEIVIVSSIAGTMCGDVKEDASGVFTISKNNKYAVSSNNASGSPAATVECEKVVLLKAALDKLYAQIRYLQDLKLGFIPYAHTVKFPDLTKIPPSLHASKLIENGAIKTTSENMKIYTKSLDSFPAIIPLTSASVGVANILAITQIKDSINVSPDTPAWSRADLGMHVAGLMLDPDSKQFFNNHVVADFEQRKIKDLGDGDKGVIKNNVKKIIILITDGMNFGGVYTNQPKDNFDNQYLYSYYPYNKHMLDVCNILKRKESSNVQIYTILVSGAFETLPKALENNIARCSSDFPAIENGLIDGKYVSPTIAENIMACSNNNGYCYKAKTDADLDKIFTRIGRRINQVVTQK